MASPIPIVRSLPLAFCHRMESVRTCHLSTWTDYYSCYAYASTYQSDREREEAITTEERTISFEVRYCAELRNLDSTHFRVVFHGDLYDIETVDFMNYQKKTIRIMCKLVKKESSHEPDHQN